MSNEGITDGVSKEYDSGNKELTKAVIYALEALSLALSDVDWRVGSPTQPVIHKAYNRLSRALQSAPDMWDANQIAMACAQAEISDGHCQSLLIQLEESNKD